MMGKGAEYIALFYNYTGNRKLLRAFMMCLLVTGCRYLHAQEPAPANQPIDSGAYVVDPSSNGLVRKDTATQSLTAMDTSRTASPSKKPLHSARKAAYLSAILPGLGQVYNKRYWKLPIIYAGFGGFGYALYYTAYNFNGFRSVDRAEKALVPNPNASFDGISDPGTVHAYQAYYKKYLDISAIGIGVWYFLTIIDATVDAHLMGWNMKDDLSVSWNPVLLTSPNYNSAAAGVSIVLHF